MFSNKEGQTMPKRIGNLDIAKEIVNNMINVDTILNILARKGLLTQEEFDTIKKEMIEKFKAEHPELFIKKTGV